MCSTPAESKHINGRSLNLKCRHKCTKQNGHWGKHDCGKQKHSTPINIIMDAEQTKWKVRRHEECLWEQGVTEYNKNEYIRGRDSFNKK